MILLRGCIIKHAPHLLFRLDISHVVEAVAAKVRLIFLANKTVTHLVHKDHIAPARSLHRKTRAAILGTFLEAVAVGTEHAAEARSIFTAVADVHCTGLQTRNDSGTVRGNKRIAGRNHVRCKTRIRNDSESRIRFPAAARKNHTLLSADVDDSLRPLHTGADHTALRVAVHIRGLVAHQDHAALLFEVSLERHHDAAAGTVATIRLRMNSADIVILTFGEDVKVALMMLGVILAGSG